MRPSKSSIKVQLKRLCRWCHDRREASQGFCTWCNNELRRKWKEYEAAMNVLINSEQALFDMTFAAAYGMGSSQNVVFGQERNALRNILDSHMKRTVEYMNDLRACRITSLNNSLDGHFSPAHSSVPLHVKPNHGSVTSATQQVDPPDLVEDDNPRDKLRAEILHYWSPEEDPRALMFVNESIHTETFLKLLLKIAPFYSWEDTTRMVNSMIIERIRHGENKQRCHIREDFWNVFETCRELNFVPTSPEAITREELENVNCRLYKWGLLKDGYDHGPDAETQGVCIGQLASCVGEQAPTAFVFTHQYRNRCRKLEEVGPVGVKDARTDEGYEGRTTLLHKCVNLQPNPNSGPQHIETPGNHRAYY